MEFQPQGHKFRYNFSGKLWSIETKNLYIIYFTSFLGGLKNFINNSFQKYFKNGYWMLGKNYSNFIFSNLKLNNQWIIKSHAEHLWPYSIGKKSLLDGIGGIIWLTKENVTTGISNCCHWKNLLLIVDSKEKATLTGPSNSKVCNYLLSRSRGNKQSKLV